MNFFFKDALIDISDALKENILWKTLGWYDVLARYRRSTLGPWWITLSTFFTILFMGPLYGSLFSIDLKNFIPHLTLGLIFWYFLSFSINEFCICFIDSVRYLKQVKLPVTVFVLRVIYRQLIIFLHNIVIYPVILIFFYHPLNINFLLFFPGLLLFLLNLFWVGILISIFCTRYRDMTPVISSIMQLLFFITPIIWSVDNLPENRRYLISWNILSTMIDILRKPLQGIAPSYNEWITIILTSLFGSLISFMVLSKVRHRITYWL